MTVEWAEPLCWEPADGLGGAPRHGVGDLPEDLARPLDGLDAEQVSVALLVWFDPPQEVVLRHRLKACADRGHPEAANRYGAVIDALKKMRKAQWSWVADRCDEKGLPRRERPARTSLRRPAPRGARDSW